MEASIHLVGPQLILTDSGYLTLDELFVLFTEKRTPKVASTGADRQFVFRPLKHMTRRYNELPWIRVQTDVFGLCGLSSSHAWTHNEEGVSCQTLGDLFGNSCHFMGIFPVMSGYCPGYMVGPGCWYHESPAGEFVYDLQPEGGLVFTRTKAQEAGVWSGRLTL
jgi:hypothetical protein